MNSSDDYPEIERAEREGEDDSVIAGAPEFFGEGGEHTEHTTTTRP